MALIRSAAVAALVATVGAQRTISGYTTTTAGEASAAPYYALGTKLLALKALVEPETGAPDWAAAKVIYEDASDSDGISLKGMGEPLTGQSNAEFTKFSTYHAGNSAYGDSFVEGALDDTVPTRRPLSTPGTMPMATLPDVVAEDAAACAQRADGVCLRDGPDGLATKSRQEMTMKGLALQKFLMVSPLPTSNSL